MTLLACALFAALAVFSSGCGGGADGATAASQPLTKAQFIKKASAICASEEERKKAGLRPLVKPGVGVFGADEKELEKMVAKVINPLYEEMIAELAALNPPTKDKQEVAAIVHKFEKYLAISEANPSLLVHRDPFGYADEAAAKYGIEGCSL